MPVVQFIMTLFATIARVERSRTKRVFSVLIARNGLKDVAVTLAWTSVYDNGLLLF